MSDPIIKTDPPLPEPPATTKTQWRDFPCDPLAIHDRYPPLGTDDTFKPVKCP